MKTNDFLPYFQVPGFSVGHAQDDDALTGCTVVLCPQGATAGVDQRGGAPGTRETDALRPMHLVQQAHAVLLTGGSAFGLDAATGVMRWLEEQGAGYDTGVARVPIVPGAVIFDLALGRADRRPDSALGYQACLNASSQPAAEGCVGAGAGATVGKVLGMSLAMKSGIGGATLILPNGLVIGALVVVNALGDVTDPDSGQIIAGARRPPGQPGGYFIDTMEMFKTFAGQVSQPDAGGGNTTIGLVATNAVLSKEQANFVAQMAQDGLARAIRPAHTLMDGDTIFTLASGKLPADLNLVGALSAETFAQAILRAVQAAHSAGGLPACA